MWGGHEGQEGEEWGEGEGKDGPERDRAKRYTCKKGREYKYIKSLLKQTSSVFLLSSSALCVCVCVCECVRVHVCVSPDYRFYSVPHIVDLNTFITITTAYMYKHAHVQLHAPLQAQVFLVSPGIQTTSIAVQLASLALTPDTWHPIGYNIHTYIYTSKCTCVS